MISPRSEFKFIPKGAGKAILLIPGWATDWRVFDSLDLPFNYLIPTKLRPSGFEEDLLGALDDNRIGKISILGWSMGGFLAADFASRHRDRVDELILSGVRRRYEKNGIKNIRAYLKRDKRAYLHKFYDGCLLEEKLKKIYLDEMDMESLMDGLDYLSRAEIAPSRLTGLKVKFIHGEEDEIAPIGEAKTLASELEKAPFIGIKGAGHFPFLSWTRI